MVAVRIPYTVDLSYKNPPIHDAGADDGEGRRKEEGKEREACYSEYTEIEVR